MRLVLMAFGSRGDVQPMIALGQGLQRAGYEVVLAASHTFADWVTAEGLGYEPFSFDAQAVMNTDAGMSWAEQSTRSPFEEINNMRRVVQSVQSQVIDDCLRVAKAGDALLSSFMTVAMMHSIAQVSGQAHVHLLLQPVTPSRYGQANMRPVLPTVYSRLNLAPGYIAQAALWHVFGDAINTLRRDKLNLPPMTRSDYFYMWNHVPILYGISPLVMPPDPAWGAHINVTGYWFYDGASDYAPPDDLAAFLADGQPPVYAGFGSMSNSDPAATAQLMIDALERSGQRGVIYSGWAGLDAANVPDHIYVLRESVPHDWLFPRMAAVVHHGGAGTTSAALRAGVPSMAIAHLGDQPYWGRRLAELGVGAPFLYRHQLSSERLASAITRMTSSAGLQQRAAQVGTLIRQEDGVANAVAAICDQLPL